MRSKAAQLLFSAVLLLLSSAASARLTQPPLPDFQDTALAESAAAVQPIDWAALEAENAVLVVLLAPFDDPENAVVALVPCDPQNRVYRLFRDLQPPTGLAIYAFDGTWNDRDKMAADPEANPTNVAVLWGLYQDQSHARYLPGPGTDPRWKFWKSPPFLGGAFGKGVGGKVDEMYDAFRLLYKPGDPAGDKEIIITGFSRGSAEARAFANRIYDEAIERGEDVPQIQFVGLFDTVKAAAGLKQAIPPNVKYVAHATAGKEQRRFFPLTEVFLRDPESAGEVTVATREFYGAHSDIGGGYKDNWISNAALLWMWAQMRKAGITTVNRPDEQVTRDWNRYLEAEKTIFKWQEMQKKYYRPNRPDPWHDSRWTIDKIWPRDSRRKISE